MNNSCLFTKRIINNSYFHYFFFIKKNSYFHYQKRKIVLPKTKKKKIVLLGKGKAHWNKFLAHGQELPNVCVYSAMRHTYWANLAEHCKRYRKAWHWQIILFCFINFKGTPLVFMVISLSLILYTPCT